MYVQRAPKPYYTVEIEMTGGIVVRYIVYKLVEITGSVFILSKAFWVAN